MGHSGSVVRRRGTSTTIKMVDADTVKKICDIYDWDGKGELDLFYLGQTDLESRARWHSASTPSATAPCSAFLLAVRAAPAPSASLSSIIRIFSPHLLDTCM